MIIEDEVKAAHVTQRLQRFLFTIFFGFVILIALSSDSLAQSTDRDNPTPLASGEIQGAGGEQKTVYYYTFEGGPGAVSATLEAKTKKGAKSASIGIELFDARSNSLTSSLLNEGLSSFSSISPATAATFDLTPVSGVDLTGAWKCNDGATYFIRRAGVEVFWYCKTQGFSNVFHGSLTGGDVITGKWADVPPGAVHNVGHLSLVIKGHNRIELTKQTGNFGGTVWTRQ